jgi:ABC-type glycerol-3-phosphate transport system permease component
MFDFPAKRVLFYLVLSGLMIPFTVVLVPVVQLLADVGWVNTYQGLIVPKLASALGCFLYRQFFLSAPLELAEAARIDLLMAGSLIAVVPVLAVALVAQRRVVEGLTLGAVR